MVVLGGDGQQVFTLEGSGVDLWHLLAEPIDLDEADRARWRVSTVQAPERVAQDIAPVLEELTRRATLSRPASEVADGDPWSTGSAARARRAACPSSCAPGRLALFTIGSVYNGRGFGAYDTIGGFVVFGGLLVMSMPIVTAVGRREPDPRMLRILKWALFLKLLGGAARYVVVSELYSGFGDSALYHRYGLVLAQLFRQGIFHANIGPVIGTGFIDIVTGVTYTLIGPTKVGGFIFFSWLGFWGLLLFYRAFCIALPDADHFRYCAARILHAVDDLLAVGDREGRLDDAGARPVRQRCRTHSRAKAGRLPRAGARPARQRDGAPHVSVIVMVGLCTSYLLRRTPDKKSPIGPIAKVAGIVLIVAATGVILRQAEGYLKVDSLTNQKTITDLQATTREQTTQGFSKFDTPKKGGLSQLPLGIVTLVFRPFPGRRRAVKASSHPSKGCC